MTTTEPPNENPPSLRPQSLPSLPPTPATPQEIIVELSRLSVVMAHQSAMTKEDQALRFAALCEDLKGKTVDEIRDGCRRYRRNPKNRFFPTPGELLEACRNPFASPPGRGYGPTPEHPEPLPREVAAAIVEKRRQESGHWWRGAGEELSIAALKEEILARPPVQPTPIPMTRTQRNILLRSLKRTLEHKYGGQAGKMIAELPEHDVW